MAQITWGPHSLTGWHAEAIIATMILLMILGAFFVAAVAVETIREMRRKRAARDAEFQEAINDPEFMPAPPPPRKD